MSGSSGYRHLKANGHCRKGMNSQSLQSSNKPYWLLRKVSAITTATRRAATRESEEKEAKARATKAKAKDSRPEPSREIATIALKPDITPDIVRIPPVEDSELSKNSVNTTLGKVELRESLCV